MGIISFLQSAMDNFNYSDDYRLACESLEIWEKGISEGRLQIPDKEMLMEYIKKEYRRKKSIDVLVFLSACMNFPFAYTPAINIVKEHNLKVKCEKQFNDLFEIKGSGLSSRARELYNKS